MSRHSNRHVPVRPPVWQTIGVFLFPLTLWGFPVLGIAIGKWILEGSTGFWSHLTNWNWLLQGVFYASLWIAFLIDWCVNDSSNRSCSSHRRKRKDATFWTHSLLFPVAWAMCWLVFWLAFFMVGDSPDQVLKLMDLYGGAYDPGFVLVMDRLLHVVPAVVNLFYVALRRYELGYFVSYYFRNHQPHALNRTRFHWLGTMLLLFYVGPAFLILLYLLLFDPNQVYNLSLHPALLYVSGLGILVVFQTAFVLLHRNYSFASYLSSRKPKDPGYCGSVGNN